MCKISEHLQLCTCKTNDVKSLKHYWILSRPKHNGPFTIGEIITPEQLNPEIEQFNQETLIQQLNSGNCFDVKLNHQEDDVLVLHFSCNKSYLAYSFTFKNNKWEIGEYDAFSNGLRKIKGGKIEKPFQEPVK